MRLTRMWPICRIAGATALCAVAMLTSWSARAAPPGEIPFGVYDPQGDFADDPDIQIEHVFLPWEDVYIPSLFTADQYARDKNRALLLTIEPWTWSRSDRNRPERLIAGIQSGEYDVYMRDICSAIGEFESPSIIRWGQEMDDESGQFIWSNWRPDVYVDAFRRMVDICRNEAPSIRVMWSPLGRDNLEEYYPGSDYVDIVGLSVFGFEAWEQDILGAAQSFEDVLGPRYEKVIQFDKPIAIAELGYLGSPDYVSRWNSDVRRGAQQFPNLVGVIYFNQREVYPWPDNYGLPDWRLATSSFQPGSVSENGPSAAVSDAAGAALTDGRPEFLVFGDAGAIARAAELLADLGATVLRQLDMPALGNGFLVIDLNDLITQEELTERFAQADIPVTVDVNSIYDLSAPERYEHRLIGFATGSPCELRDEVGVGIVDGPIDLNNLALRNVSIQSKSVLGERAAPGSFDHATAIASLIAARGEDGETLGLAPGARIFSAIAFEASNGRDIARLENIAKGLDWLVAQEVPIINLSLEGRYNRVLERIVGLVASRGAVLVAAVGNTGESQIAYPAADANVIAITAVDAAKRPYRQASLGPEVEFAAPGVELVVAAINGTAIASGTSYASAIAAAVIAREAQFGAITTPGVRDALRMRSEDLGAKGRDPVFGWGLIKSAGC